MEIVDLPDFAALQQLAKALWREGKMRGAAVLVGSGFSRNAQLLHEGGAVPPLWDDLANEMQRRLGSANAQWKNPLRLAEELRALLGEPALEGLIRDLVTDEEWLPGDLHRKLLHLPWVDVLTTNWDTLLERAANSVLDHAYETVRSSEDIATTRSPRIVKLHGSLPSNRPFILSEEDYRTYPRRFAPFVNLVQQVLLENELCLVGFSGDDPNFLAWSGWIRDELGDSARRIYLVGALNLQSSQRRLLELRNISVIDFHPLLTRYPGRDRHAKAAELFLSFLESARPPAPWSWPWNQKKELTPYQSDPKVQAKRLIELTKLWSGQRESYPGWAVCPLTVRLELEHSTLSPDFNSASFQELTTGEHCELLFELIWRLQTALMPMPQWLQEDAKELSSKEEGWNDQYKRRFVQLYLLSQVRERKQSSADDLAKALSEGNLEPDTKATISYHICLKARDELNFAGLEKEIVNIKGEDPLWGLRKAALLCDLGRHSEAQSTVEQVLADLREKFYRNRSSIWVLSRLAWTQFLRKQLKMGWDSDSNPDPTSHHEIDPLESRISEAKCDPWDIFRSIEQRTDDDERRFMESQLAIEAKFDAGSYHDHSRTIRFIGQEPALFAWTRLADHVGLPLRVKNVDSLVSRMERAEHVVEPQSLEDYQRIFRLIQDRAKKTLEGRFSRLKTATIPQELYSVLLQRTLSVLQEALTRMTNEKGIFGGHWTARASMYIELLSRLIVRATPEEAISAWQKGGEIARLPYWRTSLFEPLNNLMQRSASAVPPSERSRLILDAIQFPLPDEKGLTGHLANDWPIAAEWIPVSDLKRSAPEDAFGARVASLIEKVRTSDEQTRSRAALWLVNLQRGDVLSVEESSAFGEALWCRREPNEGFPEATRLRPFAYLAVPGQPKEKILNMLRERSRYLSDGEHFIAVAEAARRTRSEGAINGIYTHDEALKRLEGVLQWCASTPPALDLNDMYGENRAAMAALGAYLADAIMPSLSTEDLPGDTGETLIKKQLLVPSLVQAFPQLLRLEPRLGEEVLIATIKTITSRDSDASAPGFNAIYRWIQLVRDQVLGEVPKRLVDSVVSIIETRREPGLLYALNAARHLLEASFLSRESQERIVAVLGILNAESAYASSTAKLAEERLVTLVRAATVRLASALKKAGTTNHDIEDWLASVKNDPMPEVRFSLVEKEE